jgi:hypothetical protein
MTVTGQEGTKGLIHFVPCACTSTGWTCVRSADNGSERGQTIEHQRLPQAKTNGVLTRVHGANDYIREDKAKRRA